MTWPTKKLGEICEENIKSPFKVEDADNKGIYPFFTSGSKILKHSGYLVDGENIFLATGGYAHIKYYNGSACYSSDTWSLKMKFSGGLTKYVYYWVLNKIKFFDELLFRGSGLRHLQKREFLNLEIPLPPFPIQQKIVKILDAIQEGVEVQGKIIEKTKELKKSLMADLFKFGAPSFRKGRKLKKTEIGEIPEDWEAVKLKEVCNRTQQADPSKEPEKNVKYIDVSSINNEIFKIIDYKIFKGKDAPSRARKLVEVNDIIFATIRPYLKRIAVVPQDLDREYCSTAFCVIRTHKKFLITDFIFNYLITDSFINRVSGFQSGTGYPSISDNHILNEKIPLPSLREQQEIAEILQTIDQKIEIEQKKKALYGELFKTMLNKIMNQEIDVEKIDIE
jgi:type I restriction enzyme S subunit